MPYLGNRRTRKRSPCAQKKQQRSKKASNQPYPKFIQLHNPKILVSLQWHNESCPHGKAQ